MPDLYLLQHTPNIIQKNIRLELDFLTVHPFNTVHLKVLSTAANHQREQNPHLDILREFKVVETTEKQNPVLSHIAQMPFVLLLKKQGLTVGENLSFSFWFFRLLQETLPSSSSSSHCCSGSGGRQKSCFRVASQARSPGIRITLCPGSGGTLY